MEKLYKITEGRLEEADEKPAQVQVFINPEDSEKKYLVEDLKLDEHTLHSALDPDEIARLEFEPDHNAIIFKHPMNYFASEPFTFKVGSTGAFLFKEKLVIVVLESAPLFDGMKFSKVFTPAGLILRLIVRCIAHYREHLKIIAQISDEIQQKINTSLENRQLISLFALQKSLVYYVNSINSNSVLIEKLRNNASKIGFSVEEIELLDDTLIENNQCMKQAEISSNILAGLMDARVSIVSNNLNMLMKTLNIITIAIMVPTFVVSAFSMNVKIPFSSIHFAFWIIMGLAMLSMVGFFIFWRIKRW
jgi:magnesium transporter